MEICNKKGQGNSVTHESQYRGGKKEFEMILGLSLTIMGYHPQKNPNTQKDFYSKRIQVHLENRKGSYGLNSIFIWDMCLFFLTPV